MDWNKLLNQYFGYMQLTNAQKEIIETIHTGQPTLALLPTGGGKSICFQLPVLAVSGRALVISPLIALMEDQVAQLKSKGISSTCIHSLMEVEEKKYVLSHFESFQFVYCSPEFALSTFGFEYIIQSSFSHIVIDEAHCISDWGFDFRGDYLKLKSLIQRLNKVQVLAFTATANPFVQNDILNILDIDMCIVNQSTAKNNIYLSTIEVVNMKEKIEFLIHHLNQCGPTIIYFASKRICNEVAEVLNSHFAVRTYHADMQYEDRMHVQTQFLQDHLQIICATSAFGMGVNKQNIRTIIHFHFPKSPAQFIQEIGRAGRDGALCQSIVLHEPQDYYANLNLIELSPTIEDIQLYQNGLLIEEDKKQQIEKMLSVFTIEQLTKRLQFNRVNQVRLLNKMYDYVRSNDCLSNMLKDEMNNEGNNEMNPLKEAQDTRCEKYCNNCFNKKILTFQSEHKMIVKLSKEKLLNQLFNNV